VISRLIIYNLSVIVYQQLAFCTVLEVCDAAVCMFLGVLFALKVVINYMDPPGMQYVMGVFPVPTKFVCWAELVLIHLLVPNASFLGKNQILPC